MSFARKNHHVTLEETPATAEFDALFQQYWPRICTVLTRLVGDPAEAEDLALDVFLRLYQAPPSDQSNPGGWLYRVATHLGLNALRARKRRGQYEQQAGHLDELYSQDWDPPAATEQAQDRQLVRRTLARMKPRSSQVLILRYSGLSYAEVADAVGVSRASIGTLLARAEREFEEEFSSLNQAPGGSDASD
jgi:RNA polymerase sigma-70 factor (ECF subfamily)